MKKLFFSALPAGVICLALALPAVAQQKLMGRVVNARTNQPVEEANVTYGAHKGTATNQNGYFQIPCQGPVHITITHIGYHTFTKTIQNCNASLRVALAPRTYQLSRSTVEGQTDVQQAAATAELRRADLNSQSGLRLKEALNTVPGVQMQTRSPFGGQRITIRGYYPNAGNNTNFNGLGYQLYLNDVPITNATGTTIMDAIDFSTLGRVHIIKGPSPLYGNEIAGTVNLYSRRPSQSGTTFSEQLTGGSYGLFRDNTALLTRNEDMDLSLNYGQQSYDGFRPQSASKKDYLSLTGHYNVSDKETISTYFSYNHSDEELAGNIVGVDFYAQKTIANPDYVNNDGGVKIKGFRAGITSSHTFNSHFGNKTTVFATGHTLDQNFAHGFTYYNTQNYGARTNFTYRKQTKTVGILGQLGGFLQRTNQSHNGVFIPPFIHPPFKPSDQPQIPTNQQNYAFNYNVFTKWEFDLPYNFRLTAGGILNFNKFGIRNLLNDGKLYNGSATRSNTFEPTFSPSASLLKSFGEHISVYARVSTGKTPPLLSDVIVGQTGQVNDQLKPERAVQYEVGSKGNFLNNHLSYQLALFDLKITNRLATQFQDGVSFTSNVGKQQNKGLEFALGYTVFRHPDQPISRLHLQLSYTYSHFRYDDFRVFAKNSAGQDSVTANNTGNAVAGVAPNRVNVGLNMQTKPGFYLRARYRFKDRTPVTFSNETYVKKYNLLSGRLGFKRDLGSHVGLDAFVGSNNLTGSTYYNFLFVGQNADALGDGYISPAPYKATVYGGITLNYNF